MYKPLIVALALALSACGGGGAAGTPSEVEPGGGGTSAPASLALNHTTASIAAGGTLQLSATPVNAGGAAMTGLPAPSWSTSDAAVATVSGGMVSGVGPGTATITATLTAGGATRTAIATVTVTPRAPSFTSLVLTGGTVAVGATLPLAATALDQNGKPMSGLPAPSYVTSDASRATVSAAGVVTGVAAGSATITASLTAGGVTRTAAATVTVTATPQGGSSATVRGLEHAFSPASVTITPGGTVTWTMVDDEHDVTWTGAAPPQGNIPKMDEGDSVTRTFPTAGTYTYRCARHENHNETGTVVVQGATQGGAVFTSVGVTPAAPGVSVGGTVQLAAAARDQNGQPMSGLPAATWTTSDASRATVGATGLVTGVAAGSVTVTASIASSGVTRTGSATVTVSAGPVTPTTVVVTTPGESFTPATATIGVGGTVTWEISGATHNVTFGAAAPAGGNIPDTRAGTASRQFTTAGTYDYQCTRHSGMQGRVVVQ
jgi:plastocyanin